MNNQFIRKVELFLLKKEEGLDLSQFRIVFQTKQSDLESPNSCIIRIYNLSTETIQSVLKKEYDKVLLNAGYQNGNYGAIFNGTIKQFRIGRENAVDSYIDILAGDGDIGYNQGIVNKSLSAGHTIDQALNEAIKAMPGVVLAPIVLAQNPQHIPQLRGAVLAGMARSRFRNYVSSLDSTWSINDGKAVVIKKTSYLEGEAVDINVLTGLIGVPQQTDEGIELQCLLNSRIKIGQRVRLNNAEIAQLLQQNPNAFPIQYSQWASIQNLAVIDGSATGDGLYRAFVIEHEGDSRGNPWFSKITCLAVNESAPIEKSVEGK